jgi:hypothetical protein
LSDASLRGGSLYRFGTDYETADNLERQCEAAVEHGFPHGVSSMSRASRAGAMMAARAEVELYFTVRQTGKNLFHHTVELPHPVTEQVAERFNRLFGRAVKDTDHG